MRVSKPERLSALTPRLEEVGWSHMAVDDHDTLLSVLARNGFGTKPDFLIWGSMPGATAKLGKPWAGRGISVIAAFPASLVHVFGRLGGESKVRMLAHDQIIVREVSYPDISSITMTAVDGVGKLLSIATNSSGGLLQRAISGGDIVLTMSQRAAAEQDPLVNQLRARVDS